MVERGSTFTFTRGFSYIVSILFTHVKLVKVYVRTHVKITRQWKSTFIACVAGGLSDLIATNLLPRVSHLTVPWSERGETLVGSVPL